MPNLLKSVFKHKGVLPVVLLVILIFSLAPLYPAQAVGNPLDFLGQIFDVLGGGLVWWLAWPLLLLIFFSLLLGIALSFISLFFSLVFLKWVSSGTFITLKFTSGGIVDIGWGATLTLANLAFVLILVFIAFATILKLETYGLKKLLPKFIAVVLLVNFSKVIAGAIVDIANVLIHSFLDFPFSVFLNNLNPFANEIETFKQLLGGDLSAIWDFIQKIAGLSGIMEHLMKWSLIMVFGFITSFVFGIYFILFLARYIAIWLLVILAPLAWAAWILPVTQKYWKMWWNYFLQWAFVGVIAGFFLKLSALMIEVLGKKFTDATDPCAASTPGDNLCTGDFGALFTIAKGLFSTINAFFVGGAVLAFMVIGFVISMKASKGGTEMILSWGAKTGKTLSKAAGSFIRQSPQVTKYEEGFRKKLEAMPGLNRVRGFRPGDFEIEKAKRIEAAKKPLSALPDTDAGNAALAQRATQKFAKREDVMASIDLLAQRRELDKVDQTKLPDILRQINTDSNFNAKTVYKAAPQLAPYLNLIKPSDGPDPIATRTSDARAIAKAVEGINPNDLSKDVQKSTLKDKLVALNLALDSRKLFTMGRNLELEKRKIYMDTIMDALGDASLHSNFTPSQLDQILSNVADAENDPNWHV